MIDEAGCVQALIVDPSPRIMPSNVIVPRSAFTAP